MRWRPGPRPERAYGHRQFSVRPWTTNLHCATTLVFDEDGTDCDPLLRILSNRTVRRPCGGATSPGATGRRGNGSGPLRGVQGARGRRHNHRRRRRGVSRCAALGTEDPRSGTKVNAVTSGRGMSNSMEWTFPPAGSRGLPRAAAVKAAPRSPWERESSNRPMALRSPAHQRRHRKIRCPTPPRLRATKTAAG